MLIPFATIVERYAHIPIRGILHVGAHMCEEAKDYAAQGITTVKWLEANPELVRAQKAQSPERDIHQIVCSEVDGATINFNITNNGQSSSILELGTHKDAYPYIHVTQSVPMTTKRIDTLFAENKWDWAPYNFLNLDIQGAELMALKGMESHLVGFDLIYTEVNTDQVYKGCVMLPELDAFMKHHGFDRLARDSSILNDVKWGDALYVRTSKRQTFALAMALKNAEKVMTAIATANVTPSHPRIVDLRFKNLEQRGDLGNQLFQIAALWALARLCPQRSTSVFIRFGPKQWKFAPQFLEAHRWYRSIHDEKDSVHCVTTWSGWEEAQGPHASILNEWKSRIPYMRPNPTTSPDDDRDIHFFNGYFQRSDLFEASAGFQSAVAKVLFRPAAHIATAVQKLSQSFAAQAQPWCAVHVRRGDYCTVRGGQSICLSWKYYLKAIHEMRRLSGHSMLRFVFFTDDRAYVEAQIKASLKPADVLAIVAKGDCQTLITASSPHIANLQDEAVFHLFAMSAAPFKIICNSTYSWWAAYLGMDETNKDSRKNTIAPAVFFPHQKGSEGILLPGWTTLVPIWENEEWNGSQLVPLGLPKHQVIPCGYCCPDALIVAADDSTLRKPYILADLIPGLLQTYRFGPDDHDAYRRMYQQSQFAVTKRKGGWDALRHYEILANGCFPIFENLHQCPENTLTHFPKTLIQQYQTKLLPWKATPEQCGLYDKAIRELLEWTRQHNSTTAHAKRICQSLNLKDDEKVLLLLGDPGINYLRELTIIGLSQVLGSRFIEYPKQACLYTSYPVKNLKQLYGYGFTYARTVDDGESKQAQEQEHAKTNARKQVKQDIRDGKYAWIMFGKVGPDEGKCGSIPHLNLWDECIAQRVLTGNQKVAFLYGGDATQSASDVHDSPHSQHLQQHRRFGPCFVRELV